LVVAGLGIIGVVVVSCLVFRFRHISGPEVFILLFLIFAACSLRFPSPAISLRGYPAKGAEAVALKICPRISSQFFSAALLFFAWMIAEALDDVFSLLSLKWIKIVSGFVLLVLALYNISSSIAVNLVDFYVLDLGPIFVSIFSFMVTLFLLVCFIIALSSSAERKLPIVMYLIIASCFFCLQCCAIVFLFLGFFQNRFWSNVEGIISFILETLEMIFVLIFCAALVRSYSYLRRNSVENKEMSIQSIPLRYSSDNY
jgi:hypothetical protein